MSDEVEDISTERYFQNDPDIPDSGRDSGTPSKWTNASQETSAQ